MASDVPFEYLMSCLQRGDPEAARQVFSRYARRLVRLAATRLPIAVRTKEDPEDVIQSVFRTFFRRQAEGRFIVDGWDHLWNVLAVITLRKCGHRIERWFADRRDVRREQPASAGDDSSDGGWHAADPKPTPTEAMLFTETLEEALRILTERERPVVMLRLQGCAIAEIAEELRCSERTALRHLESARGKFMERIQQE